MAISPYPNLHAEPAISVTPTSTSDRCASSAAVEDDAYAVLAPEMAGSYDYRTDDLLALLPEETCMLAVEYDSVKAVAAMVRDTEMLITAMRPYLRSSWRMASTSEALDGDTVALIRNSAMKLGAAHRDAYTKAHIVHRDASLGKIMHEGRGPLLDREFALLLSDEEDPRAQDGAGTVQFQSVRLVENPDLKHELRDDIESFCHLLAWTAARHARSTAPPNNRIWFLSHFDPGDLCPCYPKELMLMAYPRVLDDLRLSSTTLHGILCTVGVSLADHVFEKKTELLDHAWLTNILTANEWTDTSDATVGAPELPPPTRAGRKRRRLTSSDSFRPRKRWGQEYDEECDAASGHA